MIAVIQTNKHSGYPFHIGHVSPQDWRSNAFWAPVRMRGRQMLMARMYLREA